VIEGSFWIAVIAILYHHLGYPLLLSVLARYHGPAVEPLPDVTAEQLPSVTLIVPCHNEAAVIERKIQNLAALDYPRDRLSVVIACDGCSDNTQALATAALANCNLDATVVAYEINVGKIAVLNDQISASQSDIVALSDASSLVESDAVLRAARHFLNPDIGVVCGSYHVTDSGNPGERAYWAYQVRVKIAEARLGAPMGAHGAFYFIRRANWTSLPTDTINDDFVLPMRIVAQGFRAIYDTAIVTRELEKSRATQEFRRRVRIGAGNLQQVLRLITLASPARGWTAFTFLSGKALRAVVPLLALVACLSSVALALEGRVFFRWLLAIEVASILLALIGLVLPRRLVPRLARILGYLLGGYFAAGIGSLLLISGYGAAAWHYSRRAAAPIQLSSALPEVLQPDNKEQSKSI
jgi:cellulose synthase/poly-beta-1,6-N-acetylglucosamine synthase-like glycosyltransferase